MSIANPTLLRVGMSGLIDGRSHVVRCRVVLSVRIKGEVYFWNEYILDDGSGVFTTLSYEEDETGCVWRLFSELSPLRALSAREAAAKRVGDNVDLGRGPLKVTLVNRSRVVHVEGQAPDWLVVGDEADFFNAESGGRMLVVSWTGEEVEYYFGGTIPRRAVAEAFGLPNLRGSPAPRAHFSDSESGTSVGSMLKWVFVIMIVGFYAARLFYDGAAGARPSPPSKSPAISTTLPLAAKGALPPVGEFEIASCSTFEIGEVGNRFERREYVLRAKDGSQALLWDRIAPSGSAWLLLRPVSTPLAWTPKTAGAQRVGWRVDWGGIGFRVTRLQAHRPLAPASSAEPAGPYGFIAQENNELLVARWSESNLKLYRGTELSERDVKQSLLGR